MTRKFLMIAAVALVALTSSLGVGTAEARGWYRGWGWGGYHHYWGGYGWRGYWGPRYAYWGPRYYGYWGPHYYYAYVPYRVYYRCGC